MKQINKMIIGSVLVFGLIGCGNSTNTNSTVESDIGNLNLPTMSLNSENSNQQKASQSEIDIIKNSVHELSWAYYQEERTGNKAVRRWYVSRPSSPYVFSLMPIVDGQAGWAGVSLDAGNINIGSNTISVGNIATKSTCDYYDYGLGESNTNCIIQTDVELIKDSTVPIKFWFFQASNSNWYIMTEGHSVAYMFAGNIETGDYDWTHTVDIGVNPIFFVENGVKKLKFEENINLPTLNLNHKDETKETPKIGCTFNDVHESDWFYKYVSALCQPAIMQGIAPSYENFKPANQVSWAETTKVANLAYDYEEVKDYCSEEKYNNEEWHKCYLDFAEEKSGFSFLANTAMQRGEAIRYFVKLYWNQNLSELDAGSFLKEKGVIHGEAGNGIIDVNYLNKPLNRVELAKIALNCSQISKLELPTISGRALPYAINPSSIELPKIVEALSTDTKTLNVNGKKYNFLIPDDLLPSIAKIRETPEIDLPKIVVDIARESIGKRAPYVDKQSTIDTRLITTVFGQEPKYESADDMCNDYESKNKLQVELPSIAKGSVVCYKKETEGTKGEAHVAIISDDKGDKEIGVQDTVNGVIERAVDKDNVRGYIKPIDIELPSVATPPTNKAPTVDAGSDKTVEVNKYIQLDGTGSDSDGHITSLLWSKNGEHLGMGNTLMYKPTEVGTEIITLEAKDNDDGITTDTMRLVVTATANKAPVANAGDDKTVEVNQYVQITASGSDSDGRIVSYSWLKDGKYLSTVGSTLRYKVTKVGSTLRYKVTKVGTETITVEVKDDDGATARDTVKVTGVIVNKAPIANAGTDKTVEVNQYVLLDGSKSSDSDGHITSFYWYKGSQYLGMGMKFNYKPTTVGTETITLKVQDDDDIVRTDTMRLTITSVATLEAKLTEVSPSILNAGDMNTVLTIKGENLKNISNVFIAGVEINNFNLHGNTKIVVSIKEVHGGNAEYSVPFGYRDVIVIVDGDKQYLQNKLYVQE